MQSLNALCVGEIQFPNPKYDRDHGVQPPSASATDHCPEALRMYSYKKEKKGICWCVHVADRMASRGCVYG